jgi:hypothetical protein
MDTVSFPILQISMISNERIAKIYSTAVNYFFPSFVLIRKLFGDIEIDGYNKRFLVKFIQWSMNEGIGKKKEGTRNILNLLFIF